MTDNWRRVKASMIALAKSGSFQPVPLLPWAKVHPRLKGLGLAPWQEELCTRADPEEYLWGLIRDFIATAKSDESAKNRFLVKEEPDGSRKLIHGFISTDFLHDANGPPFANPIEMRHEWPQSLKSMVNTCNKIMRVVGALEPFHPVPRADRDAFLTEWSRPVAQGNRNGLHALVTQLWVQRSKALEWAARNPTQKEGLLDIAHALAQVKHVLIQVLGLHLYRLLMFFRKGDTPGSAVLVPQKNYTLACGDTQAVLQILSDAFAGSNQQQNVFAIDCTLLVEAACNTFGWIGDRSCVRALVTWRRDNLFENFNLNFEFRPEFTKALGPAADAAHAARSEGDWLMQEFSAPADCGTSESTKKVDAIVDSVVRAAVKKASSGRGAAVKAASSSHATAMPVADWNYDDAGDDTADGDYVPGESEETTGGDGIRRRSRRQRKTPLIATGSTLSNAQSRLPRKDGVADDSEARSAPPPATLYLPSFNNFLPSGEPPVALLPGLEPDEPEGEGDDSEGSSARRDDGMGDYHQITLIGVDPMDLESMDAEALAMFIAQADNAGGGDAGGGGGLGGGWGARKGRDVASFRRLARGERMMGGSLAC